MKNANHDAPTRQKMATATQILRDFVQTLNPGDVFRATDAALSWANSPDRILLHGRAAREVFDALIEEKAIELPPEAEIHKSLICASCGEPGGAFAAKLLPVWVLGSAGRTGRHRRRICGAG